MEQKLTLARIIGPVRNVSSPLALEWRFIARRKKKFGIDRHNSRIFRLAYNPRTREFEAKGTRYISKRNKFQPVEVSAGMIEYLRTRLDKKAIARCVAASLAAPRR